MLYAINWFVVVVLLALWSLTAWALQAFAAWAVSSAGALSEAASGVGALRVPEWLAPWVPSEIAQSLARLVSDMGPIVESLFQAAPALAGGLTVATWVLWGIGSALLILMGAGVHLLIVVRRRRSGEIGPPPIRQAAA